MTVEHHELAVDFTSDERVSVADVIERTAQSIDLKLRMPAPVLRVLDKL
jgi:hypothetical protein